MSLPTLSSEERLRRAPFLTVLMTHSVSRSFPPTPQRMPASLDAVSVAVNTPNQSKPPPPSATHTSQPRRRPSGLRPRVTLSDRTIKHHTRTHHAVWTSRSIACGSREYSGSILLSDVLSTLREVRTQATDVEMSRWATAADGGLTRSTDSGVHWLQMADGRDGRCVLRRTFRPKSSGSALLSDAPPPPREEQTLRAGGHALTPGRADRRAPDTRPAGAGDGPAPTPHPQRK